MGTQGPLKVVLDTNTVVSALIFGGRTAWLRLAWQDGRLLPLVDRATVGELVRVLAYPKFGLAAEEIEALLAELLPYVEVIGLEEIRSTRAVVRCADPEDQKFVDLAFATRADALVTGDRALLALDPELPFPIIEPARLRDRLV